jgi:hypothetical protein
MATPPAARQRQAGHRAGLSDARETTIAKKGACAMAAQVSTQPQSTRANRVEGRPPAASWSPLYRTAGVAALITAVLVPVQLAVFMAYPFPDTVAGWFQLLQDNPLAGLVNLDLLLVVDNVLLVVIALALYVALRPTSPSVTTMATGLWLLAIAMFIAANPAVEMLALSDQFAAATSEAQRSAAMAAGQALLAGWEGTAFQVGYVLGQLAGIMIGLVMVKSRHFGRALPSTLIVGNLVGFGLYLPTVGVAISAFSGLVLWAWYLLIARKFLRLAGPMAHVPGPFAT